MLYAHLVLARKIIPKLKRRLIFRISHQFSYGRKFTLVTDHQPLLAILRPKAAIPTPAALRNCPFRVWLWNWLQVFWETQHLWCTLQIIPWRVKVGQWEWKLQHTCYWKGFPFNGKGYWESHIAGPCAQQSTWWGHDGLAWLPLPQRMSYVSYLPNADFQKRWDQKMCHNFFSMSFLSLCTKMAHFTL